MMTSAKKTWNTGVISSCQYLQHNCDPKVLREVVASKAQDVYNSVIDAKTAPSESNDDSNSATNSASEEKS